MNCAICGTHMEKILEAVVLKTHPATYYHCPSCLFVQVKDPHWLAEAYEHPINASDTGLLARNMEFSEITAVLLYFYFNRQGTFIDYAGGYGIFTRLMRDMNFDFYWFDPFSQNILARGFEYEEKTADKIELLTIFEYFEHMKDPLAEFKKMLDISKNILFSTMLTPEQSLPPSDWFYYGFRHGQHISFFSKKTLAHIARINGLYFYTNGKNLHLFTEKKLPFFSFRFLYLLKRIGFVKYIRRVMGSKINADSAYLLNSR